MATFQELYQADLKRYSGKPILYIRVLLYLFRRAQTCTNRMMNVAFRVLYRLHCSRRGLEISSQQHIGGGIYLGHAYNITINPAATIGRNCNIHKGVVIGQTNRGKHQGVPKIGNEVWIGINAAIVGGIEIGDDVLIAPNSYVNCDVPSHSVVFGNPCVIKHRDHATEGYINNKATLRGSDR